MSESVAAAEAPPATAAEVAPVLRAQGVRKEYIDATRVLQVLRDINLEVRPGEIISIVGVSGAGKSTLLQLLGGLDRPSGGSVFIEERDIATLPEPELAKARARLVGFIFQFHHLLAEFSALENVVVPGLILGRPMGEMRARAQELLELVGMADRLTHRPAKLSGGEQQRVALARALVNNPAILLADEPTGNLDTETARLVIDMLWRNIRQNNKSLVIVTHEPEIARKADRCLRLKDGILVPEV